MIKHSVNVIILINKDKDINEIMIIIIIDELMMIIIIIVVEAIITSQ